MKAFPYYSKRQLEILDEVTSGKAHELAFYCHTRAPVKIADKRVIFHGETGDMVLSLEADNTPLELNVAKTEYVTTYVPPIGAEPRHLAIRPATAIKELRLKWISSFEDSNRRFTEINR